MSRRYCCLTSLFPNVYTCLSGKDKIPPDKGAMVPRWWFLANFWVLSRPTNVLLIVPTTYNVTMSLSRDNVSRNMRISSDFVMQFLLPSVKKPQTETRMWASAQRDGRPVEYRWRPSGVASIGPGRALAQPLIQQVGPGQARFGCFHDCCLIENNYFDWLNFTFDCHDYIAVTHNRNCNRLSIPSTCVC